MKLMKKLNMPSAGSPGLAIIKQCSQDYCSLYCALRLQFQAPFVPYSLVESAIGRTCLSDTVGHLSIEIVGKGEVATKVGEGVNIVEDLAITPYFRRVRC